MILAARPEARTMSLASLTWPRNVTQVSRLGLPPSAFFGPACPCQGFNPRLLGATRSPTSTHPLLNVCSASVVTSHEGATSDETDPFPSPVPHLRWGVGAEQGPRETMEDVVQVVPNGKCGFFFATVYDGHSGIAAAQYLEKNLYDVFSKALDMHSLGLDAVLESDDEGLCCPLELHDVLTECYRKSDDALLKWLKSQPTVEALSGCTATTALVRSDRVIVANVGDSRAVLSRGGTAMDLSTEHRVYGRGPVVESETERVEAAGGWVDDGRVCGILAVSRAFGDPSFKGPGLKSMLKMGVADGHWDENFAASVNFTADPVTSEPDVFEVGLEPGIDEFLVVGTDGLWDVLSSKEVVSLVRADFKRGRHPEEIAQRLAQLAIKRYTADNTAVIIVDLLGEEGWAAGAVKKGGKGFLGLF